MAAGVLTARTPFGYFRPLCMATYSIERRAWGISPSLSHLTNLILIAAVAALVVIAIRHYTGDTFLATMAGVLFALHPCHVENAAWIAARADPLFSLFFILAALSYDRWRAAPAGLPIAALLLFEAALLAKEAGVTLPLYLLALGSCDRSRRPAAAEWLRGLLPLLGVAAAHFLLLRSWAMGGPGMTLAMRPLASRLKNLLAFGVVSVVPAHTEAIEGRPLLFGTVALLAAGALLVAARRRSSRVPSHVWAAVAVFVVLVGPHVISFQERYLFLPSAASSLAIAALLRGAGRRIGRAAAILLVTGWCASLGARWIGWSDAGRASRRVIAGLVEASRRPEIDEIVVANMPHRVRGAPVNGNFGAAVVLSGGRPVTVRVAASIDYPNPRADDLEDPSGEAIRVDTRAAEVRLHIPQERFSRYVWPLRPEGSVRVDRDWATILFDRPGELRVLITASASADRAALVWREGRLERLF